MDEYIIVEQMKFQLNKNNFTAAFKGTLQASENLIIPRSIIYNSHEYIITKILTRSFLNNKKIIYITFPRDSEVLEIEPDAFSNSSLKKISFPPKIEKLNGWADSASKISYVSISPENKNFKTINHQLIIGKSSPKSDIYDTILFASRDSIIITIPPYIKYIKSSSFSYTKKLQKIEFSEDSELLKIEKDAFTVSSIQMINIPSKVEELEDGWCNFTSKLIKILISPENRNFTYLDSEMKIVLGKSDLSLNCFDAVIFGSRDIGQLSIPKYIKTIFSGSFCRCLNLNELEISEDSELEIIGSNSFSRTQIPYLYIPIHVKIIGDSAFSECLFLEEIEFAENSELELIKDYAFSRLNSLYSIRIPSHVKKIGHFAFSECELLGEVIFCENAEIESFLPFAFSYINIKYILIPKSLKMIFKNAFYSCSSLTTIEFQENSQLELIDDFAFAYTKLQKIKIPKHVKKIGKSAFYFIDNLEEVDFEENAEITTICKDAFKNSGIFSLQIPEFLVDLQKGWCNGTERLANIEISPKNKRYMVLNQEMIVERSDLNSNIYDSLVFVFRDLEYLKIPSFIKHIKPYAMSDTLNLLKVEFTENSELLSIGKNAFFSSAIENLQIPENVNNLQDGWCNYMDCLKTISIHPDNKNVKYIDNQNKIIVCKSNVNQDVFDVITFAALDIEKVVIPNYIRFLAFGSFSDCYMLKSVEFSEDSKVQYIGNLCFSKTSILSISIPKNVKKIGKNSFSFCYFLCSIEFLCDDFSFDNIIFYECTNLNLISLPNATIVHQTYSIYSSFFQNKNFLFFVNANALMD